MVALIRGDGVMVCYESNFFITTGALGSPSLLFCYLQYHWIVPVSFLLVVVFLLVIPLVTRPADTGMGLIMVLSGIPVYYIGVVWTDKPKGFQRKVGKYLFDLEELFCFSIHLPMPRVAFAKRMTPNSLCYIHVYIIRDK